MSFCPNCGEPTAEDSLFCEACGTRLDEPVETQGAFPAEDTPDLGGEAAAQAPDDVPVAPAPDEAPVEPVPDAVPADPAPQAPEAEDASATQPMLQVPPAKPGPLSAPRLVILSVAVVVLAAGGWFFFLRDTGQEAPSALGDLAAPAAAGPEAGAEADPSAVAGETPQPPAGATPAADPSSRTPAPVSDQPAPQRRAAAPSRRSAEPDNLLGSNQFVRIEPGSFQMGSLDGVDAERPRHQVQITRPFYLQRTEITQGQWRQVMGDNPSHYQDCGDDCPVENVSWEDVQRFLARLNESASRGSYRLPTEAEWEYAARAGSTGDYGGSGRLPEMGWYNRNADYRTHPVGEKAPNEWGLHDMHGNVMEWVADWYHAEFYSWPTALTDPAGPPEGTTRVARGGSWFDDEYMARSAYRGELNPSTRLGRIGFRLVWMPNG